MAVFSIIGMATAVDQPGVEEALRRRGTLRDRSGSTSTSTSATRPRETPQVPAALELTDGRTPDPARHDRATRPTRRHARCGARSVQLSRSAPGGGELPPLRPQVRHVGVQHLDARGPAPASRCVRIRPRRCRGHRTTMASTRRSESRRRPRSPRVEAEPGQVVRSWGRSGTPPCAGGPSPRRWPDRCPATICSTAGAAPDPSSLASRCSGGTKWKVGARGPLGGESRHAARAARRAPSAPLDHP